jgi:valyl-tRNA synthetase
MQTARDANDALAAYRFDEAANIIYQFFWGEFCDWYLEIVKLRLDFSDGSDKTKTASALATLVATLESSQRLLSPFMPFITEEIWQTIYDGATPESSIALSRYPKADEDYVGRQILLNTFVDMSSLQNLIRTVRNHRKERKIPERLEVPIRVYADSVVHESHKRNFDTIRRLAHVSELHQTDPKSQGLGGLSHLGFLEIDLIYEANAAIDVAAERERLTKELARQEKALASAERQLSNQAFLDKAPPHVVEGLRKAAAENRLLIEKTRKALDDLPQEGVE